MSPAPNPTKNVRPVDTGGAQMDDSYRGVRNMRRRILGVILLACVGLTAISARQAQNVPGLGTGEVTVKGVVAIANTVPVTQSGAWKVGVDGSPEVRIGNEPIVWIAPPS